MTLNGPGPPAVEYVPAKGGLGSLTTDANRLSAPGAGGAEGRLFSVAGVNVENSLCVLCVYFWRGRLKVPLSLLGVQKGKKVRVVATVGACKPKGPGVH